MKYQSNPISRGHARNAIRIAKTDPAKAYYIDEYRVELVTWYAKMAVRYARVS